MSKVTIEQIAEFFRQYETGRVTRENFQVYLESLWPVVTLGSDKDQLLLWQDFYQKVFDFKLDFFSLELPAPRVDFGRLVVVAEGLTLNQVLKACRDHFNVQSYVENLDKDIPTNDRTSMSSYAIRLRDQVEIGKEFAKISADFLKKCGVSGITLLERLLLELMHFIQTGKHLDIEGTTLCSGSRYVHYRFGVPAVSWSVEFDTLIISWQNSEHSGSLTAAREVVA